MLGMITVGVGFVTGFMEDNIKFELACLAIGGAEFLVGWLLEKKMRNA